MVGATREHFLYRLIVWHSPLCVNSQIVLFGNRHTINGMTLTETIRQHIQQRLDGGESRYAIAKGADLDYPSFIRWLDEGRDVRASTLDKLAKYLGCELICGQRK